jgi:hypothetical protein
MSREQLLTMGYFKKCEQYGIAVQIVKWDNITPFLVGPLTFLKG